MTINVIPQPQSIQMGTGAFTVSGATRIQATADTASIAPILTELIRPIQSQHVGEGSPVANVINLALAENGGPPESYTLKVTPEAIDITAADTAGIFYALQTLRQLLPADLEGGHPAANVEWTIPAVTIEDSPRFKWRGLHLDVGRHFFPVSFVKKYIDLMALHKMNVFHWHLTDDQGWRIEIKQYPRLTEVGSKRAATPLLADRKTLDGTPYGGFYTQDEIKDVVAYAKARHITVVPEIEMPGHAVAALTSYPNLGCVGEGYEVRQFWGIADDVFCAGNEEVYTFLQNALTEVLELFPSEFIHIGGDECPKVRWQACPKCQAAIQREGLKDEHELQSYFVRRMEKFLNDKGRRLVGWDEILEGGLAPNATVMSWRGSKGGIDAATAGHDVVMSPNTHCYLDYYQSEDHASEPPTIGGFISLEKAYEFDPTAGIPADKAAHVLGGQGNVWTEYMNTSDIVEYMTYPRAIALAEAMWTASDQRSFDDFKQRLSAHLQRLDRLGARYRPLD